MEGWLKQEIIENIEGIQNLYEYVLAIGLKLLEYSGYSLEFDNEEKIIERLLLYKIVKRGGNYYRYNFSESGHDFYVKALYLASKE